MKKMTRDLNLWIVRNAHSPKTRTIFFLFTLALFILSAGAPDATGGIGLRSIILPVR